MINYMRWSTCNYSVAGRMLQTQRCCRNRQRSICTKQAPTAKMRGATHLYQQIWLRLMSDLRQTWGEILEINCHRVFEVTHRHTNISKKTTRMHARRGWRFWNTRALHCNHSISWQLEYVLCELNETCTAVSNTVLHTNACRFLR